MVYHDLMPKIQCNLIFDLHGYVQALIWSKMSTGLPIEISSSMKGQNYFSFCKLDIDIHRYVLFNNLIRTMGSVVVGITLRLL